MTRADAMGVLLAYIDRPITGAQGRCLGGPPKAEQRTAVANHQRPPDGVLRWAALPRGLRATPRLIAGRGCWTAGRFKHGVTCKPFDAVYVSRARPQGVSGAGCANPLGLLCFAAGVFSIRCAGTGSQSPAFKP